VKGYLSNGDLGAFTSNGNDVTSCSLVTTAVISRPMSSNFEYNKAHGISICYQRNTCVVPGAVSRDRHSRAEPHRFMGYVRKGTLRLVTS
jgi:hypothetical protein